MILAGKALTLALAVDNLPCQVISCSPPGMPLPSLLKLVLMPLDSRDVDCPCTARAAQPQQHDAVFEDLHLISGIKCPTEPAMDRWHVSMQGGMPNAIGIRLTHVDVTEQDSHRDARQQCQWRPCSGSFVCVCQWHAASSVPHDAAEASAVTSRASSKHCTSPSETQLLESQSL